MAKKSISHRRSTASRSSSRPPTWFPTLESLPPYHTVRVPPEHVETWLDGIIQFAQQPATHTTYRELWSRQQRIAQNIASSNWEQDSSHQLIWWSLAHGSLRYGLDTFLPPPYDGLPLAVRQWLYVHAFLVQGPQAIPQVERIMAIWLAAPVVGAALSKRARKQLGTPAGVLLFVHDLNRLIEASPATIDQDIDAVAERAIKLLRPSTWREAAERTQGQCRTTLAGHLSSAIWETIATKWGHLQGLDAIAQALDGNMNITPTAVADDIMNDLRHIFPSAAASYTEKDPANPKKRLRRYVSEIPIDQDDDQEEAKGKAQLMSADQLCMSITERHDERLDLDKLKAALPRFLGEHPEHRDGLDLYLYDGPLTQQQQAKVLGVAVKTLNNRENRAVSAFRTWVMKS